MHPDVSIFNKQFLIVERSRYIFIFKRPIEELPSEKSSLPRE